MLRFLVTEKILFPKTLIGVVFISRSIFSPYKNDTVRVHLGEQLKMIKPLYCYSVAVFCFIIIYYNQFLFIVYQ